MAFHWIFSESKSLQVSKTLLWILAVLSNAVIWIVSIRQPISKSSGPFNNPLDIVSKPPITSCIIIIIIIYSSRVFHICIADGYYYYYYYYLLIRNFLIRNSGGSHTGVWVTASLLKSLGHFSTFWPFSIR